jgi:hypothetical protein
MSSAPPHRSLPEQRLNELLRRVDWRFLLRQREAPRLLDLAGGPTAEALRLVGEAAPRAAQAADLVVLGFPGRKELRIARESLRPGGELVCLWQRPRALGVRRARARLHRAGFADARFYWPGPDPSRDPEFWLPIEAPAAIEQVLSQRPPHSRKDAALRLAWRAAAQAGTVAPICAVASLGGSAGGPADDEIDGTLPDPEPWLLLSGGSESDNKVVGLPFPDGRPAPGLVAKFGRVPKADLALDREAELLRRLRGERGDLAGVPWVRASGRRAGGRAIVQEAMQGQTLDKALSRSTYPTVAAQMTDWIASLAGEPRPEPSSAWSERLIADPLNELERDFGDRIPAGLPERARRALGELGDLPLVWEHRDLGPWNVAIGDSGAPGVIDWEDAEPRGLPCLDLVYFLASSALLVEGALDDTGDVERILAGYRRLLDPGAETGRVFSACLDEYRAPLGIAADDLRRLRLLCWIVQSLIANRRLAPGAPGDYFIHLAEDELRQLGGAP